MEVKMDPSIIQILQDLEAWRKNKNRRGTPIPIEFWPRIKKAHHDFPNQHIKAILKINSESWKKYILQKLPDLKEASKEALTPQNFLNLGPHNLSADSTAPKLKLILGVGIELFIYS
jgi:hypothetical protein